ncbi:MAG: AMP-dependent synthetase/ligase [Aquabacterium sp.]
MPMTSAAVKAGPAAPSPGDDAPPMSDGYAGFVAAPVQLRETAARLANQPAYWVRREQGWQSTSWARYAEQVEQAAQALVALGVQQGDAVAILSFNRPEWSTAAYAAMSIGAMPVGIYWTSSSADIEYILNHCAAPVLFVEDAQRMQKVGACADRLQHLHTVVQFSGEPVSIHRGAQIDWASFLALGQPARATPSLASTVQQRLSLIRPQDTASLIYTSGTTGPSKAVMISHGNLWWVATSLRKLFRADERDRMLSYLPLAHIAEQMGTMHNQVYAGFSVYYAQSIKQLGEHLKEVRPTVFFGVPRVWEKMQAAIEAKLSQATGVKAGLARWAMDVGQRWHQADLEGRFPGVWLILQRQLAHRLIHGKVQAALGFQHARMLSTGAAPISAESLRFFTGLGLVVRELYGQSEACGPSTLSVPGATRLGSVGRPLPGSHIKVADDGELLVKGPHIFQGYLHQPQATAQCMQDGWLLSGDLGHIDEDGFVFITGRKKDLIITSGGKNISPANIEAALMDDHLIEYAVVCGDGRHYLTALLTLEPQALAEFAANHGLPVTDLQRLQQHPRVTEALQAAVDHVNEQLARVAQIRKFTVLKRGLSIEGGELTPTMKVRRKVVLDREKDVIQAMYEERA